jgi:spermidine dehydrogenase
MRQNAMVMRADTDTHAASVIYFANGQFPRASAKAVILAGQSYTAQHLVTHLLDEETRQAWEQFKHAPVVTANVTLRRAAPLIDLGLGYQCYWWGSKHWADFVVADWTSARRHNRERPTVLTFYSSNTTPAAEIHSERIKLLQTPFADYENTLRADLSRVLADTDFDFDRDVTAIYVYRWGHERVMPTLGFPFGAPTVQGRQVTRTLAPRHRARRLLGRIAFASQDVESSPSMKSAIASGWRTSQEALAQL